MCQVRCHQVRVGSNSEELNLSGCLPGYLRKRTSLDAVGMSQTCQFQTHTPQQTASLRRYSITTSARPSSVGGIVRPIDFAVLRLITNSNVVGCSIGISLGFAPATILLT
jgi:hypothetical protein